MKIKKEKKRKKEEYILSCIPQIDFHDAKIILSTPTTIPLMQLETKDVRLITLHVSLKEYWGHESQQKLQLGNCNRNEGNVLEGKDFSFQHAK